MRTSIPYLMGQALYCLALKPLVGPRGIFILTLGLLKLIGAFGKLLREYSTALILVCLELRNIFQTAYFIYQQGPTSC